VHLRVLALLAVVDGCGTVADVEPAILLGTGESEFVALDDGDDIEIVFGPQGGYHVLGSIRVQGVEAGEADQLGAATNPSVSFDFLAEGQSILLSGDFVQGLEHAAADAAPWSHELIGRRVILDIEDDDPWVELDGELRVSLTDVEDRTVEGAVAVRTVKSPWNP
jgi:hypothetical protein